MIRFHLVSFLLILAITGSHIVSVICGDFKGFKNDQEYVVVAKSDSIATEARSNPDCNGMLDIGYCSRESAMKAVRKCEVWNNGPCSQKCFEITKSPFRCFQNEEECLKPRPGECSWYSHCLEAKYKCGPSGYPNFVGFYCRKFYEMCSKRLSSKGAFWCSETRQCLIEQANEKLFQASNGKAALSCKDVQTFGFNSHPGCYTQKQASFCDLPLEDIMHVIKVLKIKDIFKLDTMKQMLEVGKICLRRNRGHVANLIDLHFNQLA